MWPVLLTLLSSPASGDTLEDYQPLPGYLTVEQVEPVIEQSLASFSTCVAGAPGAEPASFSITLDVTAEGHVSHAQVTRASEEPTATRCMQRVACALHFPAHHQLEDRWTFSIAGRSGKAWLLPSLEHRSPPRLPLFIHLPEPDDPALLDSLAQALGPGIYPIVPPPPLPSCPLSPPPTASEPPAGAPQP